MVLTIRSAYKKPLIDPTPICGVSCWTTKTITETFTKHSYSF